MLIVSTWLWGKKWGTDYSQKLFVGLKRNIRQEFRTVLISDQTYPDSGADVVCAIPRDDYPLLAILGCLARMRVFSASMQEQMGAKKGDRIVNIDVDAVVTGELDPLFDRDDEFTILQGFNSTNPCPFNGSLWMFRAGERHDVSDDFSLEQYHARKVPFHAIPDDQGWLHYKFPDAKAYTPKDGAYCFKKKTWSSGDDALPAGARVVAFPGRDPAKFLHLAWVKRHWQR